MSERRSLYFVIWYSKDCLWLSPGFHDWLLDPPLSCARPPTWLHQPRLSRTTAGKGRGLRSRRRRWPWESAGRPARTASLRLYRAEPRPLPWNLLGASRPQHGWIHDQTRASCTMYHRLRTLPPLARPWSRVSAPLISRTLTFVLRAADPGCVVRNCAEQIQCKKGQQLPLYCSAPLTALTASCYARSPA